MMIEAKTWRKASEFRAAIGRMVLAFFGEGGNYYINGADILPSPLTREEEAACLAKLEDDPMAADTLIRHNLRLVVYIAKKFESTGIGIEDLISIEILMYIRKNASHKGDISIDEPLHMDWDGNELLLSDVLGSDENTVSRDLERDEDEKTIRQAVAGLCERERVIIEMRYGLSGRREMTQKEVADVLGISQSYISRLEKKIIGRLKKEIESKV